VVLDSVIMLTILMLCLTACLMMLRGVVPVLLMSCADVTASLARAVVDKYVTINYVNRGHLTPCKSIGYTPPPLLF
jgi:hypothetical protein